MGGRVDTNVSVNKSQFAENTSGNRNFSTKTNGRSYEKETENLPEDFDVKHYVTDQVEAQNQSSKTCALRAGIKTNKKAKLLATTLQT